MSYQIAQHQTGKSGISAFYYPEFINIPTFNGYTKDDATFDATFPTQKFSRLFLITEPIPACVDENDVPTLFTTCYIRDNYRKTKGVISMLGNDIISLTIGVMEIVWFLNRLFRGTKPGYFDTK